MAESSLANAAKVEKALGDLRKLPLLPATAQQAMTLANDDSSNLHEFSHLIEQDVTLATSLLKLANSPVYSWGRTIDSLGQAVVRLGLRECQNLMMAVSMGNLFQKSDPRTKGYCAVLWKHCFLTACVCRRLNQELHYDYQGEEFTAALLHDLGRILLAVTMPDRFPEADPLDFVEDPSILQREHAVLHTDHCQLGATYAEQNRLPLPAIAAIRYHHRPFDSADHRGVLGLVTVADDMANFLQRGERLETYSLVKNAGYEFLEKGWSVEKVAEFKRIIPKLLKEASQVVTEKAAPTARKAALKPATAPTTESSGSFLDSVRSWLGG
jgi:HD-like signal output (HDOD) protein